MTQEVAGNARVLVGAVWGTAQGWAREFLTKGELVGLVPQGQGSQPVQMR